METKQKLALFKNLKHNYETVCDERFDGFDEYVRMTEFVEVEFPPLRDSEVVEKQLRALDSAESELRSKFHEALGQLEQKRAELRAITYVPTPARQVDGTEDAYLQ